MLLISNGISTAICTDRLSLVVTPWRREGGWREGGGGWRRKGGGGRVGKGGWVRGG